MAPSESAPSPTASFYDMSMHYPIPSLWQEHMANDSKGDDEENEYNTIRHAKGGKGVKLLYSKSKVRG